MSLLPYVDYFYDLIGSHAYLLLNGDHDRLDQVMDYLKENHVSCVRSGVSKFPARSGTQYRWFIRITGNNGEKPNPDIIHDLMRDFRDNGKLQELQEHFSNRFAELTKKLQSQVSENRRLATERAELVQAASASSEQTVELNAELSMLYEELAKYEKQLQEKDRFTEVFLEEYEELEETRRAQDQMLTSANEHVVALRQELSELRSQLNTSSNSTANLASRLVEDVASILENLLPNVRFLQDSLQVITSRLEDPLPLLQCMGDIVQQKKRGTKVQGATQWQEMRFSTGQDHTGRLYFRVQDDCYEVLVSTKQNQDKDINYLKRI